MRLTLGFVKERKIVVLNCFPPENSGKPSCSKVPAGFIACESSCVVARGNLYLKIPSSYFQFSVPAPDSIILKINAL